MTAQNFTNQKFYFAQSLLNDLETEEHDRLSYQLLVESCLTQFYLAYRALVLEIAEHYQLDINASISHFEVSEQLLGHLEQRLSENGITSPELKQISNLGQDKDSFLSLLSQRFEQLITGRLWPVAQENQQKTNPGNADAKSRIAMQLIEIKDENKKSYDLLGELNIINKAMKILVEEVRNSLLEY